MYELWIPIQNRALDATGRAALIAQLRRARPQRVLLVCNRVLYDATDRDRELSLFCDNKRVLEQAGFLVGAWLAPTIGYGSPCNPRDHGAPYLHMVRFDGTPIGDAYCPLGDAFVDDFCNLVRAIAKTGVDAILFEDDFTFTGGKTWGGNFSCACDAHMARYGALLGEKIDRAQLCDLLYGHGPSKYRRTWFSMQGEILSDFCKKIRAAANEVNPALRIGLSANASSYVQEGIGIDRLTKIVAGDTRPFLRLTGAPYWPNLPVFSGCIDAVRVQTAWCEDGIDLITEGDTYPRPRHWVSGNQLEAYDMILRAAGKTHGILKYMMDYNSRADYETGYVDRHLRNAAAYNYLETNFKGTPTGLQIFEHPTLLDEVTFGDDYPFSAYGEGNYLPLASQLLCGECALPTVYGEGDGALLCFGESARHLSEDMLGRGVLLDAAAAKLLHARGIDVGLTDWERMDAPTVEYFPAEQDVISCVSGGSPVFYRFTLRESATVQSQFLCLPSTLCGVPNAADLDSIEKLPACYTYENASGQRFMVYSFVAQSVQYDTKSFPRSGLFRNYYRQAQLIAGITWLQGGRSLPAVCPKNPGLYLLCRREGERLHVGIWNLSTDSVLDPKIQLDRAYKQVSIFGGSGRLEENCVLLDDDIPPFGYIFFAVK